MSLPGPLRAHAVRPLPWLLAALALAAVVVGLGYRKQHDDRVWDRSALRVQGEVVRGLRGGQLQVRYTHPVTRQAVTADVNTWGVDDGLRPGDPVALHVDADSPEHLAVAGALKPPVDLRALIILLGVPAVACGLRWWSVARTYRLVRRPGTTFAMLGAVAPAGRLRRKPMLHLYALDAPPGAPSLCTVRVLTTEGVPVAGPAFPVHVKGVPRPMGRVVARVGEGDAVLWPGGRAAMGGSLPRPGRVAVPVPPPPLDAAALPAWVGTRGRFTQRTSAVLGLVPTLGAFAAAVLFGLLATATTITNAAAFRTERLHRVQVVGEAMEVHTGSGRVDVSYTYGGRSYTDSARAAITENYTVGRKYPLLIDPRHPETAIISRERYDRGTPIVWGWLPAVVTGVMAARTLRAWRRARRAARHGPWFRMDLWPATGPAAGEALLLGNQEDGYPRGAIVGRGVVPALRNLWATGGVLGPSTLWALTPPGAAITVAGRPEPGGVVALIDGDGDVYVVPHALTVPGPIPLLDAS